MAKKIYITRTDGKKLNEEESRLGREVNHRKFDSMGEAINFLGQHLKKVNKEGDYRIDTKEK